MIACRRLHAGWSNRSYGQRQPCCPALEHGWGREARSPVAVDRCSPMHLKTIRDPPVPACEENRTRLAGPWTGLARKARITSVDASDSTARRTGMRSFGFRFGGRPAGDASGAQCGVTQAGSVGLPIVSGLQRMAGGLTSRDRAGGILRSAASFPDSVASSRARSCVLAQVSALRVPVALQPPTPGGQESEAWAVRTKP